jgi:Mrp family chromosome partitioning ATPase
MAETDFRWVAGDTLEFLKDRKTAPIECIPTPIPSWNALCGEEGGHDGLAKTWTVVVGGMPGSRKSYLALNLAAHAIRQGKKVGAINFEMSFEGYATRLGGARTSPTSLGLRQSPRPIASSRIRVEPSSPTTLRPSTSAISTKPTRSLPT